MSEERRHVDDRLGAPGEAGREQGKGGAPADRSAGAPADPRLDARLPQRGEARPSERGGASAEAAADAARLEQAERERGEYLDMLKRLQAEFANYRKRVDRERTDLAARASERLVQQLLPLLDDLERALDAAHEHPEVKLEDGVRLVHRGLAGLLQREGLVEVPTDGAFDPHSQEALLSQPSEAPEGTVIQVLQKGFMLGKHVLRPARVVVSAGLAPAPEGGAAEAPEGERRGEDGEGGA